jgi:hypothetical protein
MKTDRYTKAMLTIIAACLVITTFEKVNIIPQAHAAPTPLAPPSAQYGLVPLNRDGSINVKISNETMDVKITGVSTFDAMPVNIEEVNGRRVFDAIPVKGN